MTRIGKNEAISGTVRRKIEIEFLFIDLALCTRCKGTDSNLDEVLTEVSRVLETAGVEVSVRKILVESDEQAKALDFFSSPTIRINGRDIALEFRESRCASCEACACNGEINCRVWVFQGREYTEAPKAMIVDAILREVYHGGKPAEPPMRPKETPENLHRFFAGKEALSAAKTFSCCPPDEQADCCPPSEKEACCEVSGSGGCGCR